MHLAWIFLAFFLGLVIGFLLGVLVGINTVYVGSIVVHKKPNKTVYSLEIKDDPENIQYKKRVMFKVVDSEESLNRE